MLGSWQKKESEYICAPKPAAGNHQHKLEKIVEICKNPILIEYVQKDLKRKFFFR